MDNRKSPVVKILTIFLMTVALWAAYQLYKDHKKYESADHQYEELKRSVTEGGEKLPMPKKEGQKKSETSGRSSPISVDFKKLHAMDGGSNVVGWIYVEALDISYPIMQGEDNDYYLHRDMAGGYAVSGSIFLDSQNSADFSDQNSIIFGHNMADGSMFGQMKEFSIGTAFQTSPYVWILTEEKESCYQIFSAQVVEVTSECYTLYSEPDAYYVDFLKRMHLNSGIDTGEWKFRETDKIVTLSTCNGDGSATTRYVVQAVKIN
ncbi:SrtB family sortase [Clostridium sp. AF19-22AC]|jgi:sortase B|uniref:class B sortase n=1 Tax=Clostridia TaxID=186801 RepID=UPI000E4E0032|nr:MULTISPECIES: class B sortase [Clostridia]RHR25823.1 SrtB family sortase [Clostridium sp. AF19-22AC]